MISGAGLPTARLRISSSSARASSASLARAVLVHPVVAGGLAGELLERPLERRLGSLHQGVGVPLDEPGEALLAGAFFEVPGLPTPGRFGVLAEAANPFGMMLEIPAQPQAGESPGVLVRVLLDDRAEQPFHRRRHRVDHQGIATHSSCSGLADEKIDGAVVFGPVKAALDDPDQCVDGSRFRGRRLGDRQEPADIRSRLGVLLSVGPVSAPRPSWRSLRT